MKTKILIILIILIGLSVGVFLIYKNFFQPEEKELIVRWIEWFQKENKEPITKLQLKRSQELKDNRIGVDRLFYYCYDCPEWDYTEGYTGDDCFASYSNPEPTYSLGFK
jgi:hypothetical protein